MEIDKQNSGFISDWKQITINDVIFNFIRLNGIDKNKFIIEIDGVGEVGSASLNCYDENFNGCYLDNIRKTKDKFIKEANIIHNNKYDYSKFIYINAKIEDRKSVV
jgi:hypothetical protein